MFQSWSVVADWCLCHSLREIWTLCFLMKMAAVCTSAWRTIYCQPAWMILRNPITRWSHVLMSSLTSQRYWKDHAFSFATSPLLQWHHLAYLCVSTRSYVVRAAIYPNITIYWGRSSVIKVLSPEGCELIAVRRDKSSECYIKFIWKVKMMYLSILREITYE